CVNVANLLLGRSLKRHREFAIRVALGSGRSRVVRQVLAESLMLSTMAMSLGIGIAMAAVRSLRVLHPIELPAGVTLEVDSEVLLFAVALAGATAICFGCLPAWRASQTDISTALKATGQPRSARVSGAALGRSLVAVEIACAIVLSVGAGLLTKSIVHLGDTPLGFNPDGLLTMTVTIPSTTYPAPNQRAMLYERTIETLSTLPSVEGVAISTALRRGHSNSLLTIEGRPQPTMDTAVPDVGQDFVSPDYFRVMGVPTREGRTFEEADTDSAAPVAIINEALARKYFPNVDPIGRRIKYGSPPPESPWVRIVGVVGNQKGMDVFHEMNWVETPSMFRPVSQNPPTAATLVLKTSGSPAFVGPTVQQRIAVLDPDIPVANVETMREHIAKDLSYPQFRAAVLAGFASLALLLAGVGLSRSCLNSWRSARRSLAYVLRSGLDVGIWYAWSRCGEASRA
ncbi:MAG TPA: ABC transporter permease, partial [Vicinamibacterales bacterium]|nr:ABC transporter permease [Vicinamibacterales bacterium]